MRYPLVTTALVLSAGALYFVGCTDTNQLPTAPPEFNEGRVPSPRERIQKRAPQARINALIRAAFSDKGDRNNAQKQMARIKNALARGDLAEGQALTFVFIDFVRGNADDINAAADLTAELMAFAQISGTAGVVGSDGGDLVFPDARAALSVPPGALPEDVLISFFKKDQPCFPVSEIPADEQFDDCYTFEPEGLQFQVDVRVEVCLDLEETDPRVLDVRLHGRDDPGPPEVLPDVDHTLINCEGFPRFASIESNRLERFARAGLNRLIGLLKPEPLFAANALFVAKRLGGTRGSFTDIGWALPQGEPDLIIESLTHSPASPTTEDLITFTAVVKNIGTAPADASTLRFTIGGETPGEATDFAVPLLAPGATFNVERQLVLNVARNYGTTAIADVLNDVAESDEANNQKTDLFTVALPPPDLIIDRFTHSPASPTTVDLITFTAVVKNIGGSASGPSTMGIDVGGEPAPGQTFPVPPLAPGEEASIQRQLFLTVAQSYLNYATADVNDDVAEWDEGNNQALDIFVVTPGVIDYESLPGGAPLVQVDLPVALTNEFEIVGVVFSYTPTGNNPVPGSPRICNSNGQDPPWVPANNHSVSWPSPDPNCFGGFLGTITMDFPGLPSEVRFLLRHVLGAPVPLPTITAVDENGSATALSTVLSTPTSYTSLNENDWQEQTVTVTTGPNGGGQIMRIEVLWPGGGGILLIDDLEIDP